VTSPGSPQTVLKKKKPNPTDRHVGARVRMRRLMLDMTQTELADGLGLTFQQVQKYEKGANRIGASRLQHIADILQVPIRFSSKERARPANSRPSSRSHCSFRTSWRHRKALRL